MMTVLARALDVGQSRVGGICSRIAVRPARPASARQRRSHLFLVPAILQTTGNIVWRN